MAYQVLARKWRPNNFKQLVGQEHVSQSLVHALQHDRLHHAYLFTGTRGVGKTTVARILAKAINCENLQDGNPCGICRICRDFEEGRFLDLIEVDAASRTRVEDTRELLDNVQYAPNQGRYKVYLIDEVHMLSGHSFNALLKTLEEPPPHVKFLLATTDPHKIPVTVLSRCLQFNLKRLSPEQIADQLHFILRQEEIDCEEPAIRLLARAADGSLRDALSLLDQAIVYGAGTVSAGAVTGMLGTVAQQPVADILRALADGDAGRVLVCIAGIAELAPDFADILQQILRVLHRVAISQQLTEFVDGEFDRALIADLAQAIAVEDVQLFYQIGLIGQRDLELAPDPRSGFEMVMLRMLAFRPLPSGGLPQIEFPAGSAVREPVPAKTRPAPRPQAVLSTPDQAAATDWRSIIAGLNVSGRARELANNCVLAALDDHECRLLLDPAYQRIGSRSEDNLREALEAYFGKKLRLIITQQEITQPTPADEMRKAQQDRQQAAVADIQADPSVQALAEVFGGRILPGTIEPID